MPFYDTSYDAEQDLQEIINYTIDYHGVAQMEVYIAKLNKCAENLAQKQGHFQEIDVNGKIVLVKHCQHHYIFGLVRDDLPMLVIAVFHERMDLMKRLRNRLL